MFLGCHCRELRLSAVAGVPAYVELDWMNQESSMRNTKASTARTVRHHSNRVDTAKVVGVCIEGSTLVDNFRTFEWPRASDLQELVAGSRA